MVLSCYPNGDGLLTVSAVTDRPGSVQTLGFEVSGKDGGPKFGFTTMKLENVNELYTRTYKARFPKKNYKQLSEADFVFLYAGDERLKGGPYGD